MMFSSALPVVCSTLLFALAAQSQEPVTQSLSLPGLLEEVEIRTDVWGIGHIYARNERDLFFAQGFQAARDRLFQFELWRRQATGTTAEIIGKRGLDRDIGVRLHRFRGDMQRELAHYHPRGKQIIEAYVAGVNAWITATEADPSLLPLEFELLGIRPGKWTPEIVVSRHQGLFGNATEEMANARALIRLGEKKFRELHFFHPHPPDLTLAAGIAPERLLDPAILKKFTAFRSALRFEPEDLVAASNAEVAGRLMAAVPSVLESDLAGVGSNNWVISGSRTASGSPMLANDPHRVLQVPSLRYFVHLVAPGWDVIGGGEPVLPGVSIGHNQHGAWGLTIFRTDMEDVMVYETHPEDPLRYRYEEGWERMEVEKQTFHIKGEKSVEVELKWTRHGPVLHEDAAHRTAFALRAAWLETGCAPYLASLRINQAENWAEFRQACAHHLTPPLNMVWADRAGNIGWQVSAITPVRRGWSGLLPVPGDGSHEWDGFLPVPLLPHLLNPPQGVWSTANQHVTPGDYPFPGVLGHTWSDPQRGDRVREVLEDGRRFTITDMTALQQDELSLPARLLTPLLRDLELPDGPARQARERLLEWDHKLDRDSVAAGIYVAWETRLHDELRDLLVPKEVREDIGTLSIQRVLDWLLLPDGRFGANPVTARDELLAGCLKEAVTALTKRFGPDIESWRYGQSDYKHALIGHPMSQAVDAATRTRLDVGPLPRGGNAHTVNNTSGSDNQAIGATFRIVVDTGDWDHALATSSPGQSGDPDSPHYADLFSLWATGRYFPLHYSREKVESATERVTLLKPEPTR